MHIWFIRLAALYFFIGILVGISMSMTHNFDLVGFHAHVNLLGWVSSAIFGLIYHHFSSATSSKLFQWHFWLYNLGFLVMMFGLFFLLQGNPSFEPVIAVGALILAGSVLIFLVNMWKNVRA